MDLMAIAALLEMQGILVIAAAAIHGVAIVAMTSMAPEIVAVEVLTTVDTAAPVAVGDRLVVAVVPVAVAAAENHARRSRAIAALRFTGP
jgi:hypothetical protein